MAANLYSSSFPAHLAYYNYLNYLVGPGDRTKKIYGILFQVKLDNLRSVVS